VCFLAGASLLSGCGASALQGSAMAVTVALRAEAAVDDVVQADLERRESACTGATASDLEETIDTHNACVEHEREATRDANTALDSLAAGIRAVGAGIAAATEIDAGQPLPAVLVSAVRDAFVLFDNVEAILRARGIVIPPILLIALHALEALVPAAPAP